MIFLNLILILFYNYNRCPNIYSYERKYSLFDKIVNKAEDLFDPYYYYNLRTVELSIIKANVWKNIKVNFH
jgi:hypothetical protein